jgi:adenylate cyclase
VIATRNSSLAYKGKAIDIKQVGRELGVRYILEGSVRKGANRVRITGQLIEANTGAHLWAERYDRDLADIFAVQEQITTSVASAIEPVLAEAERQRAVCKAPDSLDAWEVHHRGLWHFMKQEPIENENAKLFYRRAIDIDPDFAAGFYGLALAHLWDGWVYLTHDIGECLKLAGPPAQRAVILDGADAMAHFALSYVFSLRGDAEGARMEAERALAIDPNHAWALGGLGGCHCFNGRPQEALKQLNKAMLASPHDPLMWA